MAPSHDVVADAPGRVNLIGEHTDYNGGLVLPLAIPQRTRIRLTPETGSGVRVSTRAVPDGGGTAEFRLGEEHRTGGWVDYVQGCTWALATSGHGLGGFAAAITSDVPLGAGLSSSAALTVGMLRALRAAFDLGLDDETIAHLAHRAEHDFVGARVGIMDQMASSLADEESALFLDTRSGEWERIALPPSVEIAVIDSGVTHRHASGGYNTRRTECEEAASLLGLRTLRDLEADLDAAARIATLPEPYDRRVRHVVTENARVLDTVAALRGGDVEEVGLLLAASHASLRDDYEVSTPAVDRLVTLANADPDVLGARMTGGGFGGAIVALAWRGGAAAAAARILAAYDRAVPGGRVLVPVASA